VRKLQSVMTAAVLCDFVFDEYDGKDMNPFRDKRVREQRRVDGRVGGSIGRRNEATKH
jgi:hypothetical protein